VSCKIAHRRCTPHSRGRQIVQLASALGRSPARVLVSRKAVLCSERSVSSRRDTLSTAASRIRSRRGSSDPKIGLTAGPISAVGPPAPPSFGRVAERRALDSPVPEHFNQLPVRS
jgi:hypothetical protein